MSEITYDRATAVYRDERGRRLDCVECNGSSRYPVGGGGAHLEGECYTCGGTGWQPPEREPDTHCVGCKRPLWLGVRGPKWFTLGGGELDETSNPTCSECMRKREFRRRHPEFSGPDPNEIRLDDFEARGEDS